MTSMARRTIRATAAVTGIAAIGAGLAGTALAEETSMVPNVQATDIAKVDGIDQMGSVGIASVDGFNTESVAPTNALSADLATVLAGMNGRQNTAGPTDSLTAIGGMEGFQFEMPPTTFGTAGEQQFSDMGMAPMMEPMMVHALPAITGQTISTAAEPGGSSFGSENGLPEPVDGPANDATSPATGSVMPATADTMAMLSNSTTNDDTTSNHSFQA